jgi:hypothetical protein
MLHSLWYLPTQLRGQSIRFKQDEDDAEHELNPDELRKICGEMGQCGDALENVMEKAAPGYEEWVLRSLAELIDRKEAQP